MSSAWRSGSIALVALCWINPITNLRPITHRDLSVLWVEKIFCCEASEFSRRHSLVILWILLCLYRSLCVCATVVWACWRLHGSHKSKTAISVFNLVPLLHKKKPFVFICLRELMRMVVETIQMSYLQRDHSLPLATGFFLLAYQLTVKWK